MLLCCKCMFSWLSYFLHICFLSINKHFVWVGVGGSYPVTHHSRNNWCRIWAMLQTEAFWQGQSDEYLIAIQILELGMQNWTSAIAGLWGFVVSRYCNELNQDCGNLHLTVWCMSAVFKRESTEQMSATASRCWWCYLWCFEVKHSLTNNRSLHLIHNA